MKLHCCLNSFVSSSCFDALEISSHFPVKSKNEMKRRSISFLYYVICRYRCCPCKKILFMTIEIGFDLLRYGLSLSNFCIATAASQRGCMDRSQWTGRWDAGAAGGHGESKVILAGEVAMGDGLGREERPSKTPAYEEGRGNGARTHPQAYELANNRSREHRTHARV